MKGLKGKITDADTWNLVHYVRSLGADGKAQYTGRNMVDAHRGMNINETEYMAATDDIRADHPVVAGHGLGQRGEEPVLPLARVGVRLQVVGPAVVREDPVRQARALRRVRALRQIHLPAPSPCEVARRQECRPLGESFASPRNRRLGS